MSTGTPIVTLINSAPEALVGSTLEVTGWVRTRRDSKAGISFIQLSDGSCFDAFQVVVPSDVENYESEVLKLTTGCAVRCRGEIVESRGKGQSLEMKARELEVVGWVEDPDSYPLQPKRHSFEYLREVAHLRPRSNTFGAIGRVRHCLAMAVHRYMHENGFHWIFTASVHGTEAVFIPRDSQRMVGILKIPFESLRPVVVPFRVGIPNPPRYLWRTAMSMVVVGGIGSSGEPESRS